MNDTLDEMDLIDTCRTFHPNAEEYTFFSREHGTFSRIAHILGHTSNLSKFKKIEIISSIFSDHNSMSSVQFSRSVMSDYLQPCELQHTKPPSPTPGVHPNPCPLSWWCHPTISSCHPLLLLPPIPSSIRVFSNESTLLMRWPKHHSFQRNPRADLLQNGLVGSPCSENTVH